MEYLNTIGSIAALTFSAVGSVLGTTVAGMAAIAALKKCYIDNRSAPFILIAFVGAPLSQTIYGMILMNAILGIAKVIDPFIGLAAGILGGMAVGGSAYFQGRAGALAADAMAETGKGFGVFIMVIGIVETVGLFVMVFLMTALKT